MADRTVSVVVQAKVEQYMSSMKKASAVASNFNKEVSAAQAKQSAAWSNVAAGAAVAGAGLAVFAKKSIDAASDLQEAQSKVSVVFESSAASVQSWASTSATAMGISKTAALSAAGTYGNLFRAMGIATDKSAEMSTGLVQLASDLASFNNTSTEDALSALQSGLSGETEPLKRFGVNLNEATIKAQAMAMGLQTTTGALDPAAKAQAIYALILKDTALAQGDFQRTSGGLANQQRILAAEMDNLQASLGEALLPVMQSVVSGASTFLNALNALPGPAKTLVFAIAAVGTGLLVLAPRIAATKAAMVELGLASSATAGRMGKFAGAAKGVGVAGVALAVGLPLVGSLVDKIGDSMFGVVPTAEDFAKGLKGIAEGADPDQIGQFGGKLNDLGAEINNLDNPGLNQRIEDFFGTLAGNGGGEGRNRVLDNIAGLNEGVKALVADGHIDAARTALEKLKAEAIADGATAESLAEKFGPAQAAINAIGKTSETAAEELKSVVQEMASGVDKAKLMADTTNSLQTALDQLGGRAISVNDATAGLEAAYDGASATAKELKENQDELGNAVTKGGESLNLGSEAGRKAHEALKQIATSADAAAVAYSAAGMSSEDVKAKTEAARLEFVEQARKMGLSEEAAKRLATSYGLIPDRVKTTIESNAAGAVRNAVINYIATLNDIPEERRTQIITEYITEGSKPRRPVINGSTGQPSGATGGLFTGSSFRYANGGFVPTGPGMGGPTDDRVPALLSAGEFVLNAKAVARYGLPTLFAMNARRFGTGGAVAAALGKLNTAKDALKNARQQRASDITSMAGSLAGNMSSFNVTANAAAVEKAAKATADLAESEKKLAAARQAAKNTNSPEAIAALVAAQNEQAAAARAAAAANAEEASTRVTSTNIIADMKKRAAALEAFKTQMAKLKAMGLDQSLLTELANAGVESGGAQAAALAAGGASAITQANAAQKRIQNASRGIAGVGVSNAGVSAAEAAVAAAQVRYNNALGQTTRVGRAGNEYTLQITGNGPPLVIRLDSKEIQQGLLKLKRTSGGLALGLA